MKKLSLLIASLLLFNSMAVFADGTETTGEVYDAQIISAEVTPEETAEPAVINDIPAVIEGAAKTFSNPIFMKNDIIYVPFEEITRAFWISYSCENGVHKGTAYMRSLTINPDNSVYIFNKLQTPEASPETVNGVLYVPVSLVVRAYNLAIIVDKNGEKPILYLASAGNENAQLLENYISSTDLASDTNYLIWVSKHEYKVRVFLGSKGDWRYHRTFPCAIGAPSTPTCEGTYKYYQSQTMWDYGSYYVGPIMRFNGGYALHSTLIYKNGTPKDDRVGMRLSLGCVRLHPWDINWLSANAPLYTTVHITP